MQLGLERSYRILIFFTHIFFDIFSKYHKWIVVLLHSALGALNRRLEPFHYAFRVKNVFTFEFLIISLRGLKTHDTCV